MTNFLRRVRAIITIIGVLALAIALAACGSTSGAGSSPTLPAQIPTTVEYAGETIAGDISVQTGETALFTVTDADGNVVDPVLITAEISEPTASLSLADELLMDVSLGSFTTDGNNLVYTASNYLPPNPLGQVTAQFSYNGEVLGTSDLKISPSLADINASKYKFTDVYSTESEPVYSQVSYPDIAVDGFGNIYVCFLYGAYETVVTDKGETEQWATWAVLKRGVYSETTGVGIEWQTEEWKTRTDVTKDAEYCNVMVSNASGSNESAKVAVMWEYGNGDADDGSSELVISADGGNTFSGVIPIEYSVFDAELDQEGQVHMAALDYEGCPDGPLVDVKYLLYSGGTVTDKGNVNSERCVSGVQGGAQKPQIAVSGDGGTAYLVWQDSRNLVISLEQWLQDTYLATVSPSGTTEVKLRSDTCASSGCAAGYDADIVIDRLDRIIISWNEFTFDGWPGSPSNVVSKTHMAVLNTQTNQTEYTLLATSPEWDLSENFFFSKNSIIADYANNYHVFFRDQEAMRYVMMRTADGEIATPIVPTDEAIGNNGFTSAAADRSGRSYVVWMTGGEFRWSYSAANLTIGTSSQLLE